MTTEQSKPLGSMIQRLAARIGARYALFADVLVALERMVVWFVLFCLTFGAFLEGVVIPGGSYLKARGFEAVAWVGFTTLFVALPILLVQLAVALGARGWARRTLVMLDTILPVSSVLTRVMRWWAVVVAIGSIVTFAYQDVPQKGLPNFGWLWMLAILAGPLLPLSYVVKNRPSEAAAREREKRDAENREIQLIAVEMALSDRVNIDGKKCWMIGDEAIDAESELGKKWLAVATTAHLVDAVAAYKRGHRVKAEW